MAFRPLLRPLPDDAAPSRSVALRRATDATALRLGRAVLGYLALMTAIITLAPFRFALRPVHGLTEIWNWTDVVMNVVMFVPFGFVYQLTRPRGAPPDWPRVVVLGGLLSAGIEIAQLFAPDRYPSLIDLVTNTAGAALGALLYTQLAKRLRSERAVLSFALELPLMALVYQLIPLCWLIGLGSAGMERRAMVLPIATFAGAILGTVHAAYMVPAARHDRGWLVAMALGWAAVSLVPGTRGDPALLAAGATLTVGVALLRSIATARVRRDHAQRRFELPTLRLVLPLFAAYLALSSLWPLGEADGVWRATWALTLPQLELSQLAVYRALEHIAAFTLVGYVIAEFYGRKEHTVFSSTPRVLGWSAGLSLLLEGARGWHPAHGASALTLLFTIGAAVFGGWLYILQRDHVRALVERRTVYGR